MSSSGGTTDGGVSVPMGLLPGFRFSPTEEELLSFYLKKKIAGEDSEFSDIIPESTCASASLVICLVTR
ncbi:hypothetical protein PRUPE_2G201500 [Prunus persica]|uniref:NAC domain-containing protein n=1 Tax=Prunus persica TaxID=3760 RepID=A0A251QJT1_PRUPE|nr:hypothetical protein PRUPE_2G201500 [Prunus persica]